MKIGNKFLRIFLGEFLLIVILIFTMTVIKMVPGKTTFEKNIEEKLYFPKVFEKDIFTTNFVAVDNNLGRVDVLFKNPNLESRDEIEIVLWEGNKTIFRENYNAYNLGDTSHARADFPKISDSKGKEFILTVKGVKLVDGKLAMGAKKNEIGFIQYYDQKMSLISAIKSSVNELLIIISTQTIVLALPMVLWGAFLW